MPRTCFALGVGLAGASLCQTRSRARSKHSAGGTRNWWGRKRGPHRPCPHPSHLAEGPSCPLGRCCPLPGTQQAFNTTCWVSKGGAGSPGRPARASWVLQPFGFSDRSEQSGCGWPQALFRSSGVPCHRPALWPCQCTHSTHMAGRDSGPSLASPRKTPADQAVSAHFRGGRWTRGGEVCPPGRAGRGRARTRQST